MAPHRAGDGAGLLWMLFVCNDFFFFFDGLIVFLIVLCCLLSVWLGLTSGLSWSQECLNWNEEQEGGTGVAPCPLGLWLGLGLLFRTI